MSKTSLRVMFINLENLFSPGIPFYFNDGYQQEEYQAKVAWIGRMIAQGNVHLVGMSELGDEAEAGLEAVMAAANQHDPDNPQPFAHKFHAAPGKGSTKIRTAMISRFALSDQESLITYPANFKVDLPIPGQPEADPANWVSVPSTEFSRPVAKARVNLPNGGGFNFFVVHLKSKRPKVAGHDNENEAIAIARSAIMRNVEAAALRYYLDDFLPAQYTADPKIASILTGDFNDVPSSVPAENLRGPFDKNPGPASPWSEPDKRRLISCARLHLKNVAYQDKLYSYVHNENFTLLDYAFVTQHLTGKFKYMEIYNDHVFRHQTITTSSATAAEKLWKLKTSDHGVMVIEFTRMLG